MDREFVEKRNWMSESDMVDVVAIVQSVPGIIAVNMAILIGQRTAGLMGAIAAMRNEPELVGQLNLPKGFVPIAAMALGHSAQPAVLRVPEQKIQTDYMD